VLTFKIILNCRRRAMVARCKKIRRAFDQG